MEHSGILKIIQYKLGSGIGVYFSLLNSLKMMSYLCRELIEDKTIIDNLRKIQEEIISNKNLAGPDRPIKQHDGSFTGGVGFERNDWIVGVKKTHCYTI